MARILVGLNESHVVTTQSAILTHVLGSTSGTGTFTLPGTPEVTDDGTPSTPRLSQDGAFDDNPTGDRYGFFFSDANNRRMGISRPSTLNAGDTFSIRITINGQTFERLGLIARIGDEGVFNDGTQPSGGNVLIISFDRQTNAGDATNVFTPINGGDLTSAEELIIRNGVSGTLFFEANEIEIVAGSSFGGNIVTPAVPGRTVGTGIRDSSGNVLFPTTNNAQHSHVLPIGSTLFVGAGGSHIYSINTTPNVSTK